MNLRIILELSILLVAVSFTTVLIALLPALQALARAARSVEKLADTLHREFPPTLEAIRLTGLEISELTDEVTESVQTASDVVKQVDQSLGSAKKQAHKVQATTKSLLAGLKVAWKTLTRKRSSRSLDRLPQTSKNSIALRDSLNGDRYSGASPNRYSSHSTELSDRYSDDDEDR